MWNENWKINSIEWFLRKKMWRKIVELIKQITIKKLIHYCGWWKRWKPSWKSST